MSLFDAIEAGDLRTVRQLMRQGEDFEQVDPTSGVTPLAFAAELGHEQLVRILLRAGAAPGWGGATTPLEAAVLESHLAVAQALLDAGADVNHPVEDGFTPLITAASTGNLAAVQLLLDAGASPCQAGNLGEDALAAAREKDHADVVALLEERLIEINEDNATGDGSGPVPSKSQRPERSAAQRAEDAVLRRQLAIDAARLCAHIHAEEIIAAKRCVVEDGVDPDACDDLGRSALMLAARNGHGDLARVLINAGASFELEDDGSGWTALIHAIRSSVPDPSALTTLLISAGADPNHASHDGKTPLDHTVDAFLAGKTSDLGAWRALAEPLIHAGADLPGRGFGKLTLSARVTESALDASTPTAARRRLLALHHELEASSACVEDEIESLRLVQAVDRGDLDTVRKLLEEGADRPGRDPLASLAAHGGQWDIVRLLIEKGADIDAGDARGWTLLMYAAAEGDHEAVEQLQRAGADPRVTDGRGHTAADFAIAAGHTDIAALLGPSWSRQSEAVEAVI